MRSLLIICLLCVLPAFAAPHKKHKAKDDGPDVTVKQGQKQSQEQKQGQKQEQSVKDSNSQAQTQSSSASNNSSGNSSATSINENFPRQTPWAYAPESAPSAPCIKTYGAGGSSPLIAGSFGMGKVDPGCDARETARSFALLGNREAAAKILCSTEAAKRAGLSAEDCMKFDKASEIAPEVRPDAVPQVASGPVQKPAE